MERLINLIRRNFWYKVSAVFFAILMWSFIMTETNPVRETTFANVSVSLGNYAEVMQAQKLKIRGDIKSIFQPVVVTFKGPRNEISSLDLENLVVTPDFTKVIGPDENVRLYYKINNFSSRITTIISPGYVDVEIDSIISREIPVVINWEGELAANYFMKEPELEKPAISIKGARKDVEEVQKAVCTINRSALIESTKESYKVQLYNANNEIMPPDIFEEEIPSEIVSIEVFPKKTVSVDISESITGEDNIKDGFEISNRNVTPNTVVIYGDAEAIQGVNSLKTEKVNVSDASAGISGKAKLILPEGVNVVGAEEVLISIEINEVHTSKIFDNVPISVVGANGTKYTLSADNISVTVTGKISAVRALKAGDLSFFVDISQYKDNPGEYELDVKFDLPIGILGKDILLEPAKIKVIIGQS